MYMIAQINRNQHKFGLQGTFKSISYLKSKARLVPSHMPAFMRNLIHGRTQLGHFPNNVFEKNYLEFWQIHPKYVTGHSISVLQLQKILAFGLFQYVILCMSVLKEIPSQNKQNLSKNSMHLEISSGISSGTCTLSQALQSFDQTHASLNIKL